MRRLNTDHLSESFGRVVGCAPALSGFSKGDLLRSRFTAFSLPASGSEFKLDTSSRGDVSGAGRHMQRSRQEGRDKDDEDENCLMDVVCLMLSFNCPMSQGHRHHYFDDVPLDVSETTEYTSPHIH